MPIGARGHDVLFLRAETSFLLFYMVCSDDFLVVNLCVLLLFSSSNVDFYCICTLALWGSLLVPI